MAKANAHLARPDGITGHRIALLGAGCPAQSCAAAIGLASDFAHLIGFRSGNFTCLDAVRAQVRSSAVAASIGDCRGDREPDARLPRNVTMTSHILPSISRKYLAPQMRPFLRAAHIMETIHIVEVGQPAGVHGGAGVPRLSIAEMRSFARLGRTDFGAGVIKDTTFHPGQFVVPAYNCTRSVTVLDHHVFREFEPEPHLLRSVFEDAKPGSAAFDLGVLHTGHAQDQNVSAILNHLWNEASDGNLAWRLATESAVVTLGVALLRARARLERTPGRVLGERACDWRVRRVMERMETEIGSDVGLRELASDVGLSPSHLSVRPRTN
jgi:hypothetical protein